MGILEICGQVDSLLILPLKLFAIEQHAQVPVEYEMQALLLTKKQITSQWWQKGEGRPNLYVNLTSFASHIEGMHILIIWLLCVYEHILLMGKIGLCESHITDKASANQNSFASNIEC